MGFLSRILRGKEAPPATSARIVVKIEPAWVDRWESRRSTPADTRKCWVPPGRPVRVAGYDLDGGLLYVGQGLSTVSGWGVEPALIDPSLPVNGRSPDFAGQHMPYWPAYSEIPPASRAAYLQWLASGRNDPDAYIGYVFLYFYGLERRALADVDLLPEARAELLIISQEIERLLSIYGRNASFDGYARSLLGVLSLNQGGARVYENPPPASTNGWDLPLALKVGLGQLALDGKPLPAPWALGWIDADPQVYLRTPATRCRKEFAQLFALRYAEQFGEGMKLKPNKTPLKAFHRPASASFGGQVTVPLADLPDITALVRPIRQLRDLADKCTDELDAYSRWLGRNTGGQGSLAAVALLPEELVATYGSDDVVALVGTIEDALKGQDRAAINGANLLSRWPSSGTDKLPRKEAILLSQLLQRQGYGIEPDVRFGGPTVSGESQVIIFRLDKGAPFSPSPALQAGTLLLHFATAVSLSDGSISPKEQALLEQHLEASLGLDSSEVSRLRAHLEWLQLNPPRLTGLKRRLSDLPDAKKRSLGLFLIAVAGADGRVSAAEITTLTKIYKLLELNPETLFTHIHSLETAPAGGPVTIRDADRAKSFRIPPDPHSEMGREFVLNKDAIEAKRGETARLAALLGPIFAEEEEGMSKSRGQQTEVAGLAGDVATFVLELGKKSAWERDDVERLAEHFGLLPDGTLELINEAALDKIGEPLCDVGQSIQVDLAVFEELVS